MTAFNDRERELEARFALEEAVRFKVYARRNHLAGLWAAPLLGISGAAADEYARQLVELLFLPKDQQSLLARLERDFAAAGKPMTAAQLHAEIEHCEKEAKRQIAGAS